MDKSIEQFFVKTYIDKDYQERLLFELNSMKKRSKALSRFSHDAETVLNKVLDKRIITDLTTLRIHKDWLSQLWLMLKGQLKRKNIVKESYMGI